MLFVFKSGSSSSFWALMERSNSTMKLDDRCRPSWQMRWDLVFVKIMIQNLPRRSIWLRFISSLPLSASDLPWCSIQSKGQKWLVSRDRWVPGPGDGAATRRVGPLDPHWAPKDCPLPGTQSNFNHISVWFSVFVVFIFLSLLLVSAGKEENTRSP